jgi:hypothetical protein
MPENNHRSTDTPPPLKEEARRTTIILEPKERDFIEKLIQDGKEAGIKPLISKMLDIYQNLMIQDWHFPGEYYCGISRIALVNVELINILTQQIPKDRWFEVGKKIGEAMKVSIQSTVGVDASIPANWEAIFKRLKVQGFGNLFLKDKFLLVKTPFINDCEIWRGALEALLSVELTTQNCVPPLVFEIKTSNPSV